MIFDDHPSRTTYAYLRSLSRGDLEYDFLLEAHFGEKVQNPLVYLAVLYRTERAG